MSLIGSLAKDWLPAAILRRVRHLPVGGIRFEGNYATWEEAAARCTGYDAAPILAKVLDATLKVKRGEAVFERDSVLFDEIEYVWPVTAALMWAAAQSGGRLDVLDFGGSLGSSYFQNRAFLTGLSQVRWSVVEQAHYVEAGCQNVQDESLRFYSSIDDCLAENKPNVLLLSSVLQYLPEVLQIIKSINDSCATTLIIDRTPFNNEPTDKICVQKVPASIYKASYPMRVFSLCDFFESLTQWQVVAKIASPEGSLTTKAGLNINFQGYIFKRKDA
jgi:putative methyltransferase (TIGR04325 family)